MQIGYDARKCLLRFSSIEDGNDGIRSDEAILIFGAFGHPKQDGIGTHWRNTGSRARGGGDVPECEAGQRAAAARAEDRLGVAKPVETEAWKMWDLTARDTGMKPVFLALG
jgi:hypothetical protein